MSGEPVRASHDSNPRSITLDQLAEEQNVTPTTSLDELALDVWETDAELDDFLDDMRRSRHADLA